ncbi:50S ribosomal protein L22 [Halospeciosus flavus]|uniref:Large ribosomal subunit protein uL22 n=1 Tax=Halospeciosus flavus TaxID=3032283 RepID=A0ABD5Z9H8_9EURY|nr:50S ribosomal protein L22 [Halospeciosus flavus]
MGISYSVDVDPEVNATAMLRERAISLKHSKAISKAIKGKTVAEAQEFLDAVIDEEQSVPFKQHNSGVGHKGDIDGWDAGRYPEKASKAFQDLLRNGTNNADQQGFDGESMVIKHVAPHKVGEVQGRKPRAMGRASAWNTPEVDVELVLEEPEEEE